MRKLSGGKIIATGKGGGQIQFHGGQLHAPPVMYVVKKGLILKATTAYVTAPSARQANFASHFSSWEDVFLR